MKQPNVWDNVRSWIGHIAWVVFLWSNQMTENQYFAEIDQPLKDAIDLAAEGISYTSPYFVEKWGMDTRLAELKEIVAQRSDEKEN